MRVLIVVGGVAGLTLAALLVQQGRTPVVVEKAAEYTNAGYGLGLYPLGSCVLHGLGKYVDLLDLGQVSKTYEVADGSGKILQTADMESFIDHIGPVIMVSRTDLVDLLRDAAEGADFRMDTTVVDIYQEDDTDGPAYSSEVRVSFSDGTQEAFDAVVAADGMYSSVRTMVFGHEKPRDTGWVLWTFWAEVPDWPADLIREYWGSGTFFGFYPCRDRVMCAFGMPADEITVRARDTENARAFSRDHLSELIEEDARVGVALDAAEGYFAWPMADVRSSEWVNGRVALCGDAAAGFLPTAGVGASNAMRSAAALADELSRCGADTVPLALDLFEKRARKIVEGNQQDSRSAARYMFVENRAKACGRDQVLKLYPAERVVNQIVESMRTPF